MEKDRAIKRFNDKQIRVAWDEEQEQWLFSVVDVVGCWLKVRIRVDIGVI